MTHMCNFHLIFAFSSVHNINIKYVEQKSKEKMSSTLLDFDECWALFPVGRTSLDTHRIQWFQIVRIFHSIQAKESTIYSISLKMRFSEDFLTQQ